MKKLLVNSRKNYTTAKVGKAMNKWFSVVTEHGVRISGTMLQQKIDIFFLEKLDMVILKPQKVRLVRKDLNNIKFKRFHGEKVSADKNGADEKWSLVAK